MVFLFTAARENGLLCLSEKKARLLLLLECDDETRSDAEPGEHCRTPTPVPITKRRHIQDQLLRSIDNINQSMRDDVAAVGGGRGEGAGGTGEVEDEE